MTHMYLSYHEVNTDGLRLLCARTDSWLVVYQLPTGLVFLERLVKTQDIRLLLLEEVSGSIKQKN